MTEAEEQAAESGNADGSDLEIVAEVAAYDEELAGAVGDLFDRIETLETELDETNDRLETVNERLERTRADFKNYKQRAKRQQEEIKERATEDLVERLLDVRDNLTRALDEDSEDVESLREGVKLTRKQFDRVLDAENVRQIDPQPGEEVDANRHEVMMRVDSDQPADTIADVYRPGYEMADKILRPAQVTVSEGDDQDEEDDVSKEADVATDDDAGVEADVATSDNAGDDE
jgi:molecular chaperone GrpE